MHKGCDLLCLQSVNQAEIAKDPRSHFNPCYATRCLPWLALPIGTFAFDRPGFTLEDSRLGRFTMPEMARCSYHLCVLMGASYAAVRFEALHFR